FCSHSWIFTLENVKFCINSTIKGSFVQTGTSPVAICYESSRRVGSDILTKTGLVVHYHTIHPGAPEANQDMDLIEILIIFPYDQPARLADHILHGADRGHAHRAGDAGIYFFPLMFHRELDRIVQ